MFNFLNLGVKSLCKHDTKCKINLLYEIQRFLIGKHPISKVKQSILRHTYLQFL